jgi:hypothetical protein
MLDAAGQHIGDRLDAAMRMPGKAGAVVVRQVVAKIVQQEERIELARLAKAEGASQLDAGSFHGGFGGDDAFDGANGHGHDLSGFDLSGAYCATNGVHRGGAKKAHA